MFKRRQPFFVNLGIVWNSNDKKNQVIQDPCFKYGVTLYTCRINRQNLKLNLYKNNTTDICAIYIHHTDKLCRWLAFQFGVYTTWYLLYTSNVKYTVWWINKINQTLLISCLHTDIPQILWLYFTLPAYFVKSKLLVWQVYNSNYIKFESCFPFLVSLNIARCKNNCEIRWLQTFNMSI